MNYTQNYHLPQWALNDRIMMDDFNNAMASMENGMTSAAGKADTAVSTANSAAQTANTAKQTADAAYSPSNKPYVVGSYTGTGRDMYIHLGFRPSFLIISGIRETENPAEYVNYSAFSAISMGGRLPNRLVFSDTGFTVLDYSHGGVLPVLFEENRVYHYIAFKAFK